MVNGELRVGMFSARNINSGEELTVNYFNIIHFNFSVRKSRMRWILMDGIMMSLEGGYYEIRKLK